MLFQGFKKAYLNAYYGNVNGIEMKTIFRNLYPRTKSFRRRFLALAIPRRRYRLLITKII